ncbi:ARGOS-like protein [Cornus florida]|uniref:ARGOS-like protein n=1 Tax=Cornus florida TaxID=4283 RepID=UPI0028A02364|nr:ARGOS-like protein [Cornus florida]
MQYRRPGGGVMDMRTNKNNTHFLYKSTAPLVEGKKMEFGRSYSQGNNNRRMFPTSYFSMESLLLLICLATSLLILPLILPPLPPPPFMLLLLPIGILALLLILAFMPSNVRDISQTYV